MFAPFFFFLLQLTLCDLPSWQSFCTAEGNLRLFLSMADTSCALRIVLYVQVAASFVSFLISLDHHFSASASLWFTARQIIKRHSSTRFHLTCRSAGVYFWSANSPEPTASGKNAPRKEQNRVFSFKILHFFLKTKRKQFVYYMVHEEAIVCFWLH